MSSLDHGKIGANRPKDIFVGQNNGKSTITANILNSTKFSTFPILVSDPRNMVHSCQYTVSRSHTKGWSKIFFGRFFMFFGQNRVF